MARNRSESLDSESTWGDEFGENVVSPNHYSSRDPGNEIVSEGAHEESNNTPQSQACNKGCNSCLSKCGHYIRKLWGTCQTEEPTSNKDVIIKLMLRELIVFIFFLSIFCFVGFGMTSSTTFFFTDSVANRFINKPIHVTNPHTTFKQIKTIPEWYQFALGPLLDGLYSSTKFGFNMSQSHKSPFQRLHLLGPHKKLPLYIPHIQQDINNNKKASFIPPPPPQPSPPQPPRPQPSPPQPSPPSLPQPPFPPNPPPSNPDRINNFDAYKNLFSSRVLLENQLYGLPRLRLLRVRNNTCNTHKDFQHYVHSCYGPYNGKNEDTHQFGDMNTSAWFHQTAEQLDTSSSSYKGQIASYYGGGYVQDLNFTFNQSHAILESLMLSDWLDGSTAATRAVFIDFTIYNPNVNLFCIVRLLSEMPMTGGVVTSWSLTTVKFLRYATTQDYIVLAFECLVLLFLLYYIVEEILEVRRHRLAYFKSFFNVVDTLLVFLLVACLCLNIYRSIEVQHIFLDNNSNMSSSSSGGGVGVGDGTAGSYVEEVIDGGNSGLGDVSDSGGGVNSNSSVGYNSLISSNHNDDAKGAYKEGDMIDNADSHLNKGVANNSDSVESSYQRVVASSLDGVGDNEAESKGEVDLNAIKLKTNNPSKRNLDGNIFNPEGQNNNLPSSNNNNPTNPINPLAYSNNNPNNPNNNHQNNNPNNNRPTSKNNPINHHPKKYYGNMPLSHVDLQGIGQVQKAFDLLIAVTLFFAWIKLFKFIGFNRTLSQLTITMTTCLSDLLAFSFIFFLIFLFFAQLAFLVFGTSMQEFCTFEKALYSQFKILLGDFPYDNLVSNNQVVGPIYLMSLIFVLFFILSNMFLAIVNDAFSDVKLDLSRRRRDLEVVDYFKRGYQKMLEKLDVRRRKKKKEEGEGAVGGGRQIEVVGEQSTRETNKAKRRKMERVVRSASAHRLRKEVVKRKTYGNGSFEDSDNNDDDSSFDMGGGRRKGGLGGRGASSKGGVAQEEFSLLQRRVDRMEHSIGSIVSKIDAILVKLEGLERSRMRKKDSVTRLLDSVTESMNSSEVVREGQDKLREEGEGWDSLSTTSHHSPSSCANSGRNSHNREPPPPCQ